MHLLRQALLLHILHDSDDGEPVLISWLGLVFQSDALSEGITTRPESSRHAPADDCDTRSAGVVPAAKSCAAEQGFLITQKYSGLTAGLSTM